MLRSFRRVLSALLCFFCLCSAAASAEELEAPVWEAGELIDGEALTEELQALFGEYARESSSFSVAFYYSATGDCYYYAPDRLYYSASLYKLPLIMALEEEFAAGNVTEDSPLDLKRYEHNREKILVYSDNDAAHELMRYFGSDRRAREQFLRFSDLPEDYFGNEYLHSSEFTARFMLDVLKTLYARQDEFETVIELMLRARPDDYLRYELHDTYDIAQKYGAYESVHHAAGIIYTPTPVAVVVMTENLPHYKEFIGKVAVLLSETSLALDETRREEAERLAEERLAEEREEQERLQKEQETPPPAPTPSPAPTPEIAPAKRPDSTLWIGAAALFAIAAFALIWMLKKR